MAHRFKLFRIFEIDIMLDLSWVLCAGLIAWSLAGGVFPHMTPDLAPVVYWWMAVAATFGLFASLVFHEMAHSLVARRFGIPIHKITLFIFGGMAELEAEPPTPKSELLTAAAGPCASLVLAAISFLGEIAAVAGNAADALIGLFLRGAALSSRKDVIARPGRRERAAFDPRQSEKRGSAVP